MHSSLVSKMPPPAKSINLYKNGDQHYAGRKFIIHPKHHNQLDKLYEHATEIIQPQFGAVRNIYTPSGGTRINDINMLKSGGSYVVGGAEPYKKLKFGNYTDIGTKKRPNIKKTYSHIRPVNHNSAYAASSSRWRMAADEINRPVQLFLIVNGDIIDPPTRFLLTSKMLKSGWTRILEILTDRIGIRLGKAVRRVHRTDGSQILDIKDLENGQTYVCCGSERFKRLRYRSGGISYSAPVMKRKPLPPLKNAKPYKHNLAEDLQIKAVLVQNKPEINALQKRESKEIVPPIQPAESIRNSVASETEKNEIFQGKPVKVGRPENISNESNASHVYKPNSKVKPKYLDNRYTVKSVSPAKSMTEEIPIEKEIEREVESKLEELKIEDGRNTQNGESLSVEQPEDAVEQHGEAEQADGHFNESHGEGQISNQEEEDDGHDEGQVNNEENVDEGEEEEKENEDQQIQEEQEANNESEERKSLAQEMTASVIENAIETAEEENEHEEIEEPHLQPEDEDLEGETEAESAADILQVKNNLDNFSPRTVDSHITEVTNENGDDTKVFSGRQTDLDEITEDKEDHRESVKTDEKIYDIASPRSFTQDEELRVSTTEPEDRKERTRNGRYDDPNAEYSEELNQEVELPNSPVSKKAEELSNDALSEAMRSLSQERLDQ